MKYFVLNCSRVYSDYLYDFFLANKIVAWFITSLDSAVFLSHYTRLLVVLFFIWRNWA